MQPVLLCYFERHCFGIMLCDLCNNYCGIEIRVTENLIYILHFNFVDKKNTLID